MTQPRSSPARFALAAVFLGIGLAVVLGFAIPRWLPPVVTRHGAGIDRVILYLLFATGVLFLLGHGVLAWLVFRFTGSDGPAYPPASPRAEKRAALILVVVMCVIAEGGVVVVGMPAWGEIYGDPPADALQVEVVGKQFEWLVHYPGADGKFGKTSAKLVHDLQNPIGLDEEDPDAQDDIVKRGVLHLPVGRTTVLKLRALDVIHSFTIPQFRTKQDLIPGFVPCTSFTPTATGEFEIACAELCGLGHYRMRAFATVESPEAFQKWLSEQEPWF